MEGHGDSTLSLTACLQTEASRMNRRLFAAVLLHSAVPGTSSARLFWLGLRLRQRLAYLKSQVAHRNTERSLNQWKDLSLILINLCV